MKLPKEVRIGGVDYEVVYKDILTYGRDAVDGYIEYCENVISIIDNGESHQYQCIVLWHEILHGIAKHADMRMGDDSEHIIEVLARGIYQVLQDNGRKLFDITNPVEFDLESLTTDALMDELVRRGHSIMPNIPKVGKKDGT